MYNKLSFIVVIKKGRFSKYMNNLVRIRERYKR